MFTYYKTQYEINNTEVEFDFIKTLLNSNQSETETANDLFDKYYNFKPVGYLENKKAGVTETSDVQKKRKLKDQYSKYKQSIFPFVIFNTTIYNSKTHDKQNIKDYSGHMILDYDKLSKQEIIDMKDIFKQSQYVVLIFDSPSGNGIKVLVKINQLQRIKHDDHFFEDYFNFVKDYFESELKKVLNKDYVTDISGKNSNRGCYISFDSNYYYNNKAKPLAYTKKSVDIVQKQVKSVSNNVTSDSEVTREEMNLVIKYCNTIYDNQLPVAIDYDTWIRIGFVIKRYIKNIQAGKELFNKISTFSPGYKNQTECDKKYEELCNGKSSKEISIKYFDTLIKQQNFNLILDKEELNVLKSSRIFTTADIPMLMKQDNFLIIENEINHNIIMSWDGQKEFNYNKLGDEANVIIRRYFLEKYNIDLYKKQDISYCIYTYDRKIVNPPVEIMKEFSNKYTDMKILEENFNKMCELIPTDGVSLEDKVNLLKHFLLSVVNNLTYKRGINRKCDEILIARSDDSAGKTEWIRNLLFAPIMNWKGQFMYKESSNFKEANKDLLYQDHSTVLNYKSEIGGDLMKIPNIIKQYLSIESYTVRRSYRADEEEFISRTSFVGDTNNQYYLPNDTNLRRFLVLDITDRLKFKVKNNKNKWVENGGVNFEMIWSYMYQLHINGITYDTINIPETFLNNTSQISTDYDDAIIRKVINPQIKNTDFFSIDELLVELKRNNLNLKDTSHESIRVKLVNMGIKAVVKWDRQLKRNSRKFYPGIINCLDVVTEFSPSYTHKGVDFDEIFIDKMSVEDLNEELNKSIREENFEKARRIKNEIEKRKTIRT